MTFRFILTLFFFALPLKAGELKVATVNMRHLLSEFHESKTAEAETEAERAVLRKKEVERVKAIKALQEEMGKLKAQFQDPSLSQEKRQQMVQQFAEREENLKMLVREREEFLERSSRAINEKMVEKTSELRFKVIKTIREYADKSGFDYVMDATGVSATTNSPFLLYARNPDDITLAILKILNKDAPAESKEPAPKAEKKSGN